MENGLRRGILELASKGERIDGRKLEEFREVVVEYDLSKNAEASCLVKGGNTQVVVGVKLGLGKPYPDTPNKGNLIVNGEIAGAAAEDVEIGRPTDDEIAMARVVDRGIRESGAVDLDKLCITPGERVWDLFIDFYVLDHDGNLIDLAGLGAIACLKKAVFPQYDAETDTINVKNRTKKKLPVISEPIPVTIVKIGEYLLVDPNKDEMSNADAYITITFDEKGNVVSMQKRGSEGFTVEEFEKALKMAFNVSKKLRKLIK